MLRRRALSSLAILFASIFVSMRADAAPNRIVSLAPSITETLFAVGAGGEVVGVSDYCDFPAQVDRLPRVGSFLSPNIEAIVALRPSLVFALALSSDRRMLRALRSMGYRVVLVSDDTLADIDASIEIIGRSTGHIDDAEKIRRETRLRMASVENQVRAAPRPRTLMIVGRQPMVAVGPGTYLDELISLAHADNIARPAGEEWPHLGSEFVIAMKPEVILEGGMGGDSNAAVGSWSRLAQIPAVRERRIYPYPQNPVLHPGPRVAASLEIIARLIHPEIFAAPSAQ